MAVKCAIPARWETLRRTLEGTDEYLFRSNLDMRKEAISFSVQRLHGRVILPT
jgi:hypothetical protein